MSTVPMTAGLLVLFGLTLAAYAFWRRRSMQVTNLKELLELSYLDAVPQVDARQAASLLSRSGAFAERALAETTLLARMKGVVERSDWTLSAGELFLLSVAAAVLGGIFGGLVSPLLGLFLFLGGLAGPYSACRWSVQSRMRKFDGQFPDILDLVAASLESGASVQQAFELVVAESDEPAASEFARVLAATQVGTPLTEALQSMAARLGSRDVDWTVQAILVQQRTGGRLAEILRIVAGVMRSREEIRRELQALTAEGRLSAYILTALPIVLVGYLSMVRPTYIRPLYTTTAGLVMLVAAAFMLTASYVVMRRLVRIEV